MSILTLPNELLRLIVEHLETEKDIFALLQVNRRLYEISMPLLYQHNVQYLAGSALHRCAASGQKIGAQRLLEFQADPNTIDEHGIQPLALAIDEGHRNIIGLLLENGASLQMEDFLPIHHAVSLGNYAVVQMLLEHGGDINAIDQFGCTALYQAVESGLLDIAELLLDHGADVNMTGLDTKEARPSRISPLHAASDIDNENMLIFDLLFKYGADPNPIDDEGKTPLHWTVTGDSVAKARVLLENGADVNARALNGETPLEIAISKGNNTLKQLLLSHRADMRDPNKE
ncbi:ankyrin repeat-containing domain protein [Penicillium lagena]|uniref:ankyrin repeat-containing domain protein n=1 Tax=Penicillium lagena TaxID=94218 RepID=UPI0025416942|nr:ankyrin repeat-containing domain protein [Penicillium lagena]KAJ5613453.1 ankyrin repeat-containing domain protein [Penicillium lagena]